MAVPRACLPAGRFTSMKKDNEQGISNVIKQLFKSYHLDEKVAEVRIKEIWENVMGKSIKNYTSGMRLYKGVLTIFIDSAPLKQDLKFQKENIIQRINEELGEKAVKELVIK
ncbi:MAG: DUF721 domain-containing protein [Chitinophagales bacterium]